MVLSAAETMQEVRQAGRHVWGNALGDQLVREGLIMRVTWEQRRLCRAGYADLRGRAFKQKEQPVQGVWVKFGVSPKEQRGQRDRHRVRGPGEVWGDDIEKAAGVPSCTTCCFHP